jgi:hypothetical protein
MNSMHEKYMLDADYRAAYTYLLELGLADDEARANAEKHLPRGVQARVATQTSELRRRQAPKSRTRGVTYRVADQPASSLLRLRIMAARRLRGER